jgi:hypothetical protein
MPSSARETHFVASGTIKAGQIGQEVGECVMPFKSKAQRNWMHKNKPEMAKKWEKETPKNKKLPSKVKKKK